MSSGEDWTHHWILTNMGPTRSSAEDDASRIQNSSDHFIPDFSHDDTALLEDPFGMGDAQVPDEGISASPVTSIDLDRESPMACGLDDDDAGPPSIETQPPEQSDDIEVSRITSSWLSSGGHYGGLHPALGYSQITTDIAQDLADSTNISSSIQGLEGREFDSDVPPVYGPALPTGPYNSPVRESSPIACGDVTDDGASSGVCGLRNLGNTCFMAAGIQCLVNTPPIAQYFFKHHLDSEEAKTTLAGRFSQLTHKIWSGRYSSLRPSEFKEAFGQHWRDFRDYRQHDCQEFMTLLLEALRKQMPLNDGEEGEARPSLRDSIVDSAVDRTMSCTSSSIGSRGSRGSTSSPTPPQSPQCPPSPVSPSSLKQPFEMRSDIQEDAVTLDSGTASPKSSVSSSSVDAHLISLRLQPIPEEVKHLNKISRINTSVDNLSVPGTVSYPDADNVTSDISDSGDGVNIVSGCSVGTAGVLSVRRYNHLSTTADVAETCDTSSGNEFHKSLSLCLRDIHCDSSSTISSEDIMTKLPSDWEVPLEKNEKASLERLTIAAGTSANSHLSLVKLEDIMKETKTSNVNVLAKDSVTNNEFLFDSEKYAKFDTKKLKNSVDNLSRAGLKRVKEVNLLVDKMDNSQLDSSALAGASKLTTRTCSSAGRNSSIMSLNKRMKLEEKNVQYELEKCQSEYFDRISEAVPSTSSGHEHRGHIAGSSYSSEEQRLAEDGWKAFIGDGKSAVVDTFYGQFKSSLVCSICGHTSIKFDPFGTLSVPLPHANEKQIPVIYVPHEGGTPTRCLVTLFKVSTILDLKNALEKLVGPINHQVLITEVFDNHIAKTVEDNYQTKFLNYTLRSIYAFGIVSPPESTEQDFIETTDKNQISDEDDEDDNREDMMPDAAKDPAEGAPSSGEVSTRKNDAQWQACNICLEELCQTELKTHDGCEDCVLCEGCIEMSCKHHGGDSFSCPVCHTRLCPPDLIPVAKRKTEKPIARILRVPIVYRIDTESDDNNKREMQLIGHPSLLALPSRIKSITLTQIVKGRLLPGSAFSLLFVDGRGYNCSRCLFSSHCRGCEVLKNNSEICLQAGDTLCVRFTTISTEQKQQLCSFTEHSSLFGMRKNAPLTIYDCLKAFTQSETLEDSDSWYCPKCECKQQATKTISVWKYPPYLIIHLERFLFHGAISIKLDDKVIFPLDGLDLSDFVAGEQSSPLLYNLYSCVCHMGVAQAGHYTALVRSPVNGEWHYFNDDNVTRQKPGEEEYSTSYLLFYHRQGAKFDLNLPQHFAFSALSRKVSSRQDDGVVGSSSDTNNVVGSRKRSCMESEGELEDDGVTSMNFIRAHRTGNKTYRNTVEVDSHTASFKFGAHDPTLSGSFDESTITCNSFCSLPDSQAERGGTDNTYQMELATETCSANAGHDSLQFSHDLPTSQADCDNPSALMEE